MEYKVFKRTFLEKVEAHIGFHPAVPVSEHPEALMRFLSNEFGTPPENFKVPEEAATISASQHNGAVQIEMGNGKAVAQFSHGRYQSFERTMLPQLQRIQRYLETVEGVAEIDRLTLRKQNRWQFNCEDPVNEIASVLQVVFKPEYAKRLLPTERPGDGLSTFTISDEYSTPLKNIGTLAIDMSIEVSIPVKSLVLRLNLAAEATDVTTDNIDMVAVLLNKAIFDGFTGAVSDEVLNLMDKEA